MAGGAAVETEYGVAMERGWPPRFFRHHALDNGNLCYATAKFQPTALDFAPRWVLFQWRRRESVVAGDRGIETLRILLGVGNNAYA